MDIGTQGHTNDGWTPGLMVAAEDAEMLLEYAAQSGVDVSAETVLNIVRVRQDRGPLAPDVVSAFYAAYAQLSARLHPVTVATLRVSPDSTRRVLRRNAVISIALAMAVMVCSVATFLTASISADIDSGIGHANELAVKLRNRVGPPLSALDVNEVCVQPTRAPDPQIAPNDAVLLTGDLQEFSSTIRGLLNSSIKLGRLVPQQEFSPLDKPVPGSAWDTRPGALLQLHPELIDQRAETFCKIYAYEDVRTFAKNVHDDSVVVYGALAKYFLPILYAVLGASAYAMRDLSERLQQRTYLPSSDAGTIARTIAAVTAGAIIGLFGSLGQGLSLPPLALAFLTGYGVEGFFAFLDNLLNMFHVNRREQLGSDAACKTLNGQRRAQAQCE